MDILLCTIEYYIFFLWVNPTYYTYTFVTYCMIGGYTMYSLCRVCSPIFFWLCNLLCVCLLRKFKTCRVCFEPYMLWCLTCCFRVFFNRI